MDGLELSGAVAGPRGYALCELGGLGRISFERGHDVHPVQGREMVEVHEVILHGMLGDHDVAHQLRIDRHFDFEGVLDRANGTDRVDGGADPAEPLRKGPGVLGIAPL